MTVPRSQSQWAAIPILLLLLLAGGLPARAGMPAQPESKDGTRKPAWKWTLDERLAARFDPEAMAAREAERQAKEKELRKRWADPLAEKNARTTEQPSVQEIIYGNKTPELFLPGELFDMLLKQGFSQGRSAKDLQESRRWIDAKSAALGFGRDFWDRLGQAASPYLKLLEERDWRQPTPPKKNQVTEEEVQFCRVRSNALETAKAELGEEAFLRLLYEAVAPSAAVARLLGSPPLDYETYEEELRYQEGGCQ